MDDAPDIHICGRCRQEFTDLSVFIQHKQLCRPPTSALTRSSPAGGVVSLEPKAETADTDLRVMDSSAALSYLNSSLKQDSAIQLTESTLMKHAEASASHHGDLAAIIQPTGEAHSLETLMSTQVASDPPSLDQLPQSDLNPGQISYQLSYHNNMQVLTVITAGNHGDLEAGTLSSLAAVIPDSQTAEQITNPQVTLTLADPQDSKVKVAKSADRVPKRSKYAKLTSALKRANDETLSESPKATQTVDGAPASPPALPAPTVDHHPQPSGVPQRRYACTVPGCVYTTAYSKNMTRHGLVHSGQRPHKCTVCGARFSRSDKLKEHHRIHSGDKRYKCTHCDYSTTESGSLKKHLRIHSGERPFACQYCPHTSRNSSSLTAHLRTHTGDKPFMCDQCNARFKIKSDLKRHARIHSGERPYECHLCGAKVTIKSNLRTHMKIYHNAEKETKCTQCDFVSSSVREMRTHAKTHIKLGDPLRCTVCAFVALNLDELKTHGLEEHNDSSKPLSCSECNYFTRTKACLDRHVKTRHPKEAKRRGRTASSTKRPFKLLNTTRDVICRTTFMCSLCPADFVQEDSLRSHMRSHQEIEAKKEAKRREEEEVSEGVADDVVHPPPPPYPAENARVAEHQTLLPYTQNNHNTAVMDNIQNSAISESQEGKTTGYAEIASHELVAGPSTSGADYHHHSTDNIMSSYAQSNPFSTATETSGSTTELTNGLVPDFQHVSQPPQTLYADSSLTTIATTAPEELAAEYRVLGTVKYDPEDAETRGEDTKPIDVAHTTSVPGTTNPHPLFPPSSAATVTLKTDPQCAVASPTTPLSALSPEVQTMLRSLRLPPGTVVTVPLGDHDFQILVDGETGTDQQGDVMTQADGVTQPNVIMHTDQEVSQTLLSLPHTTTTSSPPGEEVTIIHVEPLGNHGNHALSTSLGNHGNAVSTEPAS